MQRRVCPYELPPVPHRWSRRQFLTSAAGAAALGWVSRVALAQQKNPERSAVEMMTPAAAGAIERGLSLLSGRQDDDGSFRSGGYSRNVAICALAGMAFMAGGSTPGRGRSCHAHWP